MLQEAQRLAADAHHQGTRETWEELVAYYAALLTRPAPAPVRPVSEDGF